MKTRKNHENPRNKTWKSRKSTKIHETCDSRGIQETPWKHEKTTKIHENPRNNTWQYMKITKTHENPPNLWFHGGYRRHHENTKNPRKSTKQYTKITKIHQTCDYTRGYRRHHENAKKPRKIHENSRNNTMKIAKINENLRKPTTQWILQERMKNTKFTKVLTFTIFSPWKSVKRPWKKRSWPWKPREKREIENLEISNFCFKLQPSWLALADLLDLSVFWAGLASSSPSFCVNGHKTKVAPTGSGRPGTNVQHCQS